MDIKNEEEFLGAIQQVGKYLLNKGGKKLPKTGSTGLEITDQIDENSKVVYKLSIKDLKTKRTTVFNVKFTLNRAKCI